jgi:hypothetical protein
MTKIFYAAVTDLFFIGKISSFAKAVNSKVVFVDSYEHMIESIEDNKPTGIIVDLNSFLTLAHIEHIRKKYGVKVIGYMPHVQADLKMRAEKVCDSVMTQGEFSNSLVRILS